MNERFVEGRPINLGLLSSEYGYRTDPFKRQTHLGMAASEFGRQRWQVTLLLWPRALLLGLAKRHGYWPTCGNRPIGPDGLVPAMPHAKAVSVKIGDFGPQKAVVG